MIAAVLFWMATVRAAAYAASESGAKLMVVFTESGATARHVSGERISTRVVAFTPHDRTMQRLALSWGVTAKKVSKTDAVRSQLSHDLPADAVHIGPSDYVPWLADRKWAHIRLEGRGFGDQPITVELKLEVWDSPNSAGVVIDAIRCCKVALDRGYKGALAAPSAYLMKSPPEQWPEDVAHHRLERFIAGDE